MVLYSQIGVRNACLFNSVRNLAWPEVSPSAPRDWPFCVSDYIRICNGLPLEEGGRYRLIRFRVDDLLHAKYVAYRPYKGGAGDFLGVHVVEEGVVHPYDDIFRHRLRAEKGAQRKPINGRGGRPIITSTGCRLGDPVSHGGIRHRWSWYSDRTGRRRNPKPSTEMIHTKLYGWHHPQSDCDRSTNFQRSC